MKQLSIAFFGFIACVMILWGYIDIVGSICIKLFGTTHGVVLFIAILGATIFTALCAVVMLLDNEE